MVWGLGRARLCVCVCLCGPKGVVGEKSPPLVVPSLTAAVRDHVGPLARREDEAMGAAEGHNAVMVAAVLWGRPDWGGVDQGCAHRGHVPASGEGGGREGTEEEEEEG
jgi:hypothetical protein